MQQSKEMNRFETQFRSKVFVHPVIAIPSSEYNRTELTIKRYMHDTPLNVDVYTWSLPEGLQEIQNPGTDQEQVQTIEADDRPVHMENILPTVCELAQEAKLEYKKAQAHGKDVSQVPQPLFILTGFNQYLQGELCGETAVPRQNFLKRAESILRECAGCLIMIDEDFNIPPELRSTINVVDFPLPREEEIREAIHLTVESAQHNPDFDLSLDDEKEEALVNSCKGMTDRQISDTLVSTLKQVSKFDPQLVMDAKVHMLKQTNFLEYYPPISGLGEMGGMDVLKDYIRDRGHAYTKEAKEFGLPRPKGLLLVGVPGCGKSLAAKGISAQWQMPLLALSIQNCKGSLVGESERNLRTAFKIARALEPCVLWVDEIEKGFAGVHSDVDSGVSSGLFGQFLTFMQEETSDIYVIATANRIASLPPELMRKGRFDELFYVDLPTQKEREEIFRIHIKKSKQRPPFLDPAGFDIPKLGKAAKGFSGAEIEACVQSALFPAFAQNREVTTKDILHQLDETVPQVKTNAEDIQAIRDWAHGRARNVSSLDPDIDMKDAGDRTRRIRSN